MDEFFTIHVSLRRIYIFKMKEILNTSETVQIMAQSQQLNKAFLCHLVVFFFALPSRTVPGTESCLRIKKEREKDVISLYRYGDWERKQSIWVHHMWNVLAPGNEKADCSGFSWIVSIMVNGFSKCQSSCFIDFASESEEQTHLAGILLTAAAQPCIHKANIEESLISLSHVGAISHPSTNRSLSGPSWCISITVSTTLYCSASLGRWHPLMVPLTRFSAPITIPVK